jgi:hypothetical protein
MKAVINKTTLLLFMIVSLNILSQNTSTVETNDMQFMLEEEKVARDVYEFLADKWNIKIFNNIKRSEQKHMNMMEELLTRNSVSYTLNNDRGIFINTELQILYNDLIKKGSKSFIDALEVGKLVEEKDIYDLEVAIKNTNNDFSKQVYTRLLSASQKHLNAFNRQLSK